MPGAYAFLHAAAAGFFTFAALYHFLAWLFSRRERALLAFAVHCAICAAFGTVLFRLASTNSVADAQWTYDWRNTIVVLSQISLLWVLVLIAGIRSRLVPWLITIAFAAVALATRIWPIGGTVNAIEPARTPWGEVVTAVLTTDQSAGIGIPVRILILALNLFGFYCAWRLWRRDRVGSLVLALATSAYVVFTVLGVRQFNDSGPFWFFPGSLPYMAWALLIVFQLAREQEMGLEGLRQAEAEMRTGEARYRFLVNNQPETTVEWRPDGTTTFVNESYRRVFGLAHDVTASSVFTALPEKSRDALRVDTAALTPAAPVALGEYEVLVNGESRWQQWTSKGHFDSDGGLVSVQSTGRDITDQKEAQRVRQRLEAQLTRSQTLQLVGQLAGGVAHDFNNLLTVINGYAELLAANCPEQVREEIAQIRHAGGRAASLTSQLLAYSGRRPADQTTFDVNVVVQETEQLLRRLIGPDMVLTVSSSDQAAWVAGDASQFDRALVNLVINARDAMPGGGALRISTRIASASDDDVPSASGRVVVVAVADTGMGMTEDVRARLFEPFFTTKEIGKGTGLGLAVVDGFVRSHNGAVRVESEPGSGSVFSLVLPWAEPRHAPLQREGPAPVTGGTETVLVVDDEAAIRALVSSTLEKHGYTVIVASTGDDAIAIAEDTARIDLLITDVVMAGMPGTVLAQAMQDRFPAMRVLYMSGYGADEVLRRGGRERGPILQKPFTLAGLAEKVREAVDA